MGPTGALFPEVAANAFRVRSRLARWLVVLALAVATPAVQDALTDLKMLVTGEACCADDCDETGAPCSQQCAHCPCGTLRNVTVQSGCADVPPGRGRQLVIADALVPPSSTTLDPPFRPPVS